MTVRDARSLPAGTMLDCDVCVVGTGAAGVTLALELAATDLDVCVLEAGGAGAEPAATSLSDIDCTDLPVGRESRQRRFGGTTTTWWGKVALLESLDLEPRPWVPGSGWPIGRPELDGYYRRASALMGLPDLVEFGRVPLPGAGRFPGGGSPLATPVFYWSPPALDFGVLYRRRAGRAPRVATWLHAAVTGLRVADGGRRVSEVEVAVGEAGEGGRLTVRPRAVVLACGGIENARLLLLSDRDCRGGLGNGRGQVGRWFMEHPKGPCGRVVLHPGSRLVDRLLWAGRAHAGGRVRCGIGLTPEAQVRHQVLDSYVLLDPEPAADFLEARRELRGHGIRALGDRAAAARLARRLPGAARYGLLRVAGFDPLPRFTIQNFLEQAPDPDNRVELADERDALGLRKARLRWRVSDFDRRSASVLHQVLDAELRRLGAGRVESPLLADPAGSEGAAASAPSPISQDASHHLGTTRMGRDPATSVVDADCRVHGVANLYVAGSSVFPTGGYANPTFTIVALAIRLADHLRSARP